MSTSFSVNALFAGKPQPLGPRGAPSSIVKAPVDALTVHMDRTVDRRKCCISSTRPTI